MDFPPPPAIHAPAPTKQAPAHDPAADRDVLKRCLGYLKRAKKSDQRWRKRALEGIEFYFGDQWDPDAKRAVIARGQAAITINEVRGSVKAIVGQFLGRPMDWVARPQGLHDDGLSDAATSALKYVANRNRIKSCLKQIYWDGLAYGIGWAHIGAYVAHKDARREICQVRRIDPREMRWDPMAQATDLSDARWMIWSRKVDLVDARRMFPGRKGSDLAREGEIHNEEFNVNHGLVGANGSTMTPPPSKWDLYEDWNEVDKEQDGGVEQVLIHECWESVPTKVWLIEFADGQPTEWPGPQSPDAAGWLMMPNIKNYYEDTVPKVWRHVFAGTMLLESEPSKHTHNRLPFLPYIYERDQHGDPVSLVEALKDMQRTANHRHSLLLWDMSNRPLRIDPTVPQQMGMTAKQAAEHAKLPGAAWFAQAGQIEYLQRGEMASMQFEILQHAEITMQKIAGTNDHLMGYDTPSESGRSKEISLEQGATLQRDGEEGLIAFHQGMGELLLSDIQAFHTEAWTVRVSDEVGADKLITLNEPETDPETGEARIKNDINGILFEIEIDSAPWTPTKRQRAFEAVNEMTNNEPDPILRMAMRRIALTVSDFPEKQKILDILSKAEEASMAATQQQQAQEQEAAAAEQGMKAQEMQMGADTEAAKMQMGAEAQAAKMQMDAEQGQAAQEQGAALEQAKLNAQMQMARMKMPPPGPMIGGGA